jgi:RNA polymerase sigma-70 factor, ECF subfamily
VEVAMTDCNAEAFDITLGWHPAEGCACDLERLYDEHSESLYRYAYAITGRREDAEDAVQDVFARVSDSNPTFTNVDNLRFYLLASVRNAAVSLLRKRKRRNEQDFACRIDIDDHHADDCQASVSSIVLRDAFETLPAEQKEVVVLKVYEGMTLAEISKAVGASIGTVSSRYNYALRKLRIALEEKADER